MPIVFGITFFLYVGLTETLRHGVFGLNQQEIATTSYMALAFCALVLLRADVVFLLRRPRGALYGAARYLWSWPRSVLGILLAPLILIVPVGFGASLTQIKLAFGQIDLLSEAMLFQTLAVALSIELFFREAALKAFAGNLGALVLASGLVSFIHALPGGAHVALMAAGLGLWMLALRLMGTNILVVAAIHGALWVMLNRVLTPAVTGAEIWTYAICFTVAAAGLGLIAVNLFTTRAREMRHA